MNTLGLIEGVKTSVITALNKALDEDYPTTTDPVLQRVVGNIEMEYPIEKSKYPGVWVQFSFSEIRRAGLDPIFVSEKIVDGESITKIGEMGFFKGTVTLTIVAESNIERDKIAGAIINFFLFGQLNDYSNEFFESIRQDEFIFMSPDKDSLTPRGQTMNVGAPWNQDALVYEDSYSFKVMGQFASRFDTGELIRLAKYTVNPTIKAVPDSGNGGWV